MADRSLKCTETQTDLNRTHHTQTEITDLTMNENSILHTENRITGQMGHTIKQGDLGLIITERLWFQITSLGQTKIIQLNQKQVIRETRTGQVGGTTARQNHSVPDSTK